MDEAAPEASGEGFDLGEVVGAVGVSVDEDSLRFIVNEDSGFREQRWEDLRWSSGYSLGLSMYIDQTSMRGISTSAKGDLIVMIAAVPAVLLEKSR